LLNQPGEHDASGTAKPGKLLLSPAAHTLILIDHQSQMAFATKSIDPALLSNNAAQVAKAKDFSVSKILTTVASKTFRVPIRHPETPSGSRRRGLRRLWMGR
jgi:hypothetical protein